MPPPYPVSSSRGSRAASFFYAASCFFRHAHLRVLLATQRRTSRINSLFDELGTLLTTRPDLWNNLLQRYSKVPMESSQPRISPLPPRLAAAAAVADPPPIGSPLTTHPLMLSCWQADILLNSIKCIPSLFNSVDQLQSHIRYSIDGNDPPPPGRQLLPSPAQQAPSSAQQQPLPQMTQVTQVQAAVAMSSAPAALTNLPQAPGCAPPSAAGAATTQQARQQPPLVMAEAVPLNWQVAQPPQQPQPQPQPQAQPQAWAQRQANPTPTTPNGRQQANGLHASRGAQRHSQLAQQRSQKAKQSRTQHDGQPAQPPPPPLVQHAAQATSVQAPMQQLVQPMMQPMSMQVQMAMAHVAPAEYTQIELQQGQQMGVVEGQMQMAPDGFEDEVDDEVDDDGGEDGEEEEEEDEDEDEEMGEDSSEEGEEEEGEDGEGGEE